MNTNLHKSKIINTITNLMLLFLPLSAVANLMNERISFSILYIFLFAATLKHTFCFRKHKDISKASEQILIILLGMYFAFYLIGAQETFDVLWGLSIPLVAVMTSTLNRLKFWLVATVGLTVVMIIAVGVYPEFFHYELFSLFSLLWALIFISYLAYSYKYENVSLEYEILSYQNSLEQKIAAAVAEISALNKNLDETQVEILQRLCAVGSYRSKDNGESQRMAQYVKTFAELADLPPEEIEIYGRAAPLHDLGNVGIEDTIFNKPSRLTKEEYEQVKRHTLIGEDILGGSQKPLLQIASEIAGSHHEKYDGSGYPRGLKGEAIPLSGRIVAILDVFDALYRESIYKKNWTNEDILNHFKEQKGKHFDPRLTDIFLNNIEKFVSIYEEYYIAKQELVKK